MKIKNSQVADNNSSITNSKNTVSKNYLKPDNIISFILGIVASVAASYIYDNFFK